MDIAAFLTSIGLREPALQGAALQGVLILAGLLLAAFVAGLPLARSRREQRRLQRRLREERAAQVRQALRAEIRAQYYELERHGDLDLAAAQLAEKIEAGRWTQPGYTPLLPREVPGLLLPGLQQDLLLLDPDTVDAVLRHARQTQLAIQAAEDLRGEPAQALPADRKIELAHAYFAQLRALKAGALALNRHLEEAMHLKRHQRDSQMQVPAAEPSARHGAPGSPGTAP